MEWDAIQRGQMPIRGVFKMIAIRNMEKPKSCDECPILRAEFDGSYDKPITGCRQRMGKKNTLREEWDALIFNCSLIDIVECWECEYYMGHEEYCENDHFAREYGFCYSGKRRSE